MNLIYFLGFWGIFVTICCIIIMLIPDHETSEDDSTNLEAQ